MTTTATSSIHVRVNDDIKQQSETILSEIGLSMSDLVNMTLRQLIRCRALPFEAKVDESQLPVCMRINSKEQFLNFLDAGLEADQKGHWYSSQEILASLGVN